MVDSMTGLRGLMSLMRLFLIGANFTVKFTKQCDQLVSINRFQVKCMAMYRNMTVWYEKYKHLEFTIWIK